VEEELFVRTMERLKENSKKSNKTQVKVNSFEIHLVDFAYFFPAKFCQFPLV
jgi:hypothetical protein